jgi:DMSO/TMAO reductase YedYZ heme-binding membrane subunit
LPRKWWRAIHMSSYLVLITGILHGAQAGTDSSNILYIGGVLASTLLTIFLTTHRVLTRRRCRPRELQPGDAELANGS